MNEENARSTERELNYSTDVLFSWLVPGTFLRPKGVPAKLQTTHNKFICILRRNETKTFGPTCFHHARNDDIEGIEEASTRGDLRRRDPRIADDDDGDDDHLSLVITSWRKYDVDFWP